MIIFIFAGAIADGGDLFKTDSIPKLSQLNCTGTESKISECTSNIVTDMDSCSSSAVAICQGTYTCMYMPSYLPKRNHDLTIYLALHNWVQEYFTREDSNYGI